MKGVNEMKKAQFYMGVIAGSIIGMSAAAAMMPQVQRRAQKMIKHGKKMIANNNMFDMN